MTVATSVTGFLFPFHGFIPAFIIGIISMVLLAIAIYARYSRRQWSMALDLRRHRYPLPVSEFLF